VVLSEKTGKCVLPYTDSIRVVSMKLLVSIMQNVALTTV